MEQHQLSEKALWENVVAMFGEKQKCFGPATTFSTLQHPQRLASVLSCYKFIAKMACQGKRVIEFDCGEGMGAPFLMEGASSYLGVDSDPAAIASAKGNWATEKSSFLADEFLNKSYGHFDTVVWRNPSGGTAFHPTVYNNLAVEGVCCVTTVAGKTEEIPIYKAMKALFFTVLPFSMMHTSMQSGLHAAAHHFLFVGCYKRA